MKSKQMIFRINSQFSIIRLIQKKKLNSLISEGWIIKSTNTQPQGYAAGKTCCLGCLFLPLALLGRKKDIIEYVLEKN